MIVVDVFIYIQMPSQGISPYHQQLSGKDRKNNHAFTIKRKKKETIIMCFFFIRSLKNVCISTNSTYIAPKKK